MQNNASFYGTRNYLHSHRCTDELFSAAIGVPNPPSLPEERTQRFTAFLSRDPTVCDQF